MRILARKNNRSTSLFLRVTLLLLLVVGPWGCTATALTPYEATYTTKLRGIKITGVRKLEATGKNTYRMSWSAKALWMRLEEQTEFKLIEGDRVQPLRYHYVRRGLGSDRPVHIEFDWDNMRITGSKGGKGYEFPVIESVQDKLSYQIQMQLDLKKDPGMEILQYEVANHNKIKTYEFLYRYETELKTAVGKGPARLYVREKADNQTLLWLSPSNHFLPLKIEQHEKKRKTSVDIKSWKIEEEQETLAAANTDVVEDDDF